jgi:signal transduction histidine kinase
MNYFTRLAGSALILLLVFLAAALGARSWLEYETLQLRGESIVAKRRQLVAAVALTHQPGQEWSDPYLHSLGEVVGGTVDLLGPGTPPPARDHNSFYFDTRVDDDAGAPAMVRVTFAPPATARLIALHQRVVVGLALLAAALIGMLCVLILLPQRPAADRPAPSPWVTTKAEMSGLAHLAKTSAAQREELHHERDVRLRAEEEVRFKQRLLAHSLEEKIRLGHDLHDGIIQSLYAVGLTLESVRALAPTNPAEADARLEKCRQNLNDIIRSVRTYITGLAPETLRRAGFTRALESVIDDLHAGQEVEFQQRVDEDAAARLSAEQGSDALQIASEAISNSLRHGQATLITVRLHQADREICLLIQDNGAGFDPSQPAAGHGLRNMHTRAERLGGGARIESQPGSGTRIVITFPLRDAS